MVFLLLSVLLCCEVELGVDARSALIMRVGANASCVGYPCSGKAVPHSRNDGFDGDCCMS